MISKTRILIAVYDSAAEALALRSALEQLGALVTLLYLGRPDDFFALLRGESGIPFDELILCGHGEEGGFLFPPLHESLYTPDEPRGAVGADSVRKHLRLSGKTVISTACSTGLPPMTAAFTDRSCTYLAPAGDIEGTGCFIFVILYYYHRLAGGCSAAEAFGRAAGLDGETALFALSGG